MGQPMNDFDGSKAISTKAARVWFQKNGKNVLFAECNELKAEVKKSKEKIQTLGSFGTKHKFVGWEGTGSIGGFVVSSDLLADELKALETGQEIPFNIITTFYGNDSQGNQTVLLKDVSLDTDQIGDIKSDDGLMKFESDFTFDGIELVNKFND